MKVLLQSVTTPFSIVNMKPYHFKSTSEIYVGNNFWVNLDTIQSISDLFLYEKIIPEEYWDIYPYASFDIQYAFQDKPKKIEFINGSKIRTDIYQTKEEYTLDVQTMYNELIEAWKNQ